MNGRKVQERNHVDTNRRRMSAGLCLGLLTGLAGCGGSDEVAGGTATAQAGWSVVPSHALELRPGASFDLNTTLPGNVARGGTFAIDTSGAPLPAGVSLSSRGLLVVAANASGSAGGIVFRYTPPA